MASLPSDERVHAYLVRCLVLLFLRVSGPTGGEQKWCLCPLFLGVVGVQQLVKAYFSGANYEGLNAVFDSGGL